MLKPILISIAVASTLTACGGGSIPSSTTLVQTAAKPFLTLNGQQPLVVAHRGASGYIPEETYEAYVRAIELGADAIEPDLISTKDGVLIARHDPNLAYSTDVDKHPEFANRKRTQVVDGESQTGWFASDFTLAEIKTLGGISTDAERPQQFNGQYKIVTFQEIIDLAKAKSTSTRVIAVYPETKNPTYHRAIGLPLEDKLIDMIKAAGWNSKTAPIYVQSFEPSSLKYLKSKGLNTKLIQLIDADDVDMKTGKLTFAAPYDKPYDWAVAGDKRLFSDMVTPAGLAEIKTYADGIGPWKPYIMSVKGTFGADGKQLDVNGDGKINYADATSLPPTTLIADAHKAGLMVHAYTFRNESRRIPADFKNDPKAEYKAFYRLGLDGVFSDFADTAIAARTEYVQELQAK
ncbi:glycerophosphodiester phosphodiesterase [Chitinibacter bivalviorum]|uniref:glycerophosphodiester phosphodiesterase n=1 Tax=Chitinibacter bivalviorum TaxID=2739434 RepID=A0A7H9BE79_9NEIS|nr:glycerophosphodiester phosphodiesterase [Chitinibacter bivalviorum]QLG86837.1 glycerophosphodiester phosphodiesterase [Chitinibacter bivalviorum]